MSIFLLLYLILLPNHFYEKNDVSEAIVNTKTDKKKAFIQDVETAVLNEINNFRLAKGLPALVNNDYVVTIARKHSENMAVGITPFSHDGFNNRSTIIRQKIPQIYSMAENVAYGYTDAKDVVKGWINSKGHYNNIVGKFSGSGVGVAVTNEGVLYFTQIFI